MKIFIINQFGETTSVFINSFDTIKSVKEKYRLGDVELRYQGKILDDYNNFNAYNIKEGDVLISNRKNRILAGGMGLQTIDVSKNILNDIGFSENAKNYQRVNYGLSIQSTCKNKSCIAYNDIIYIQIGFVRNWNLQNNLEKVICPACNKRAMPSNFGFCGCRYEIEYEKNEDGEFKNGTVTGTSGKEEYKIFDQYSSGNANFNKLIFNITSN